MKEKIRPGLLEGELTRLGRVLEVDKPQDYGTNNRRGLFGLTPLGPVLSLLGKTESSNSS